jgi:hypothetical protein
MAFHIVSPQKFYIAIDKSKHADLNTLLLGVPLTVMARGFGGGVFSFPTCGL